MKFCFSFGMFDIKYFFFCVLFVILEICINLFIYKDDKEDLLNKHILLDPFCNYAGCLMNIFLALINNKFSRKKSKPIPNKLKEENTQAIEYIFNNPYDKYLSKKDFLKFFGICIFLIITDLIQIIMDLNIIRDDKYDKGNKIDYINMNMNNTEIVNGTENTTKPAKFVYEDDYLFWEFLIIFILPLLLTDIVYYKHQKITFIILTLLEFSKSFYFNFIYDKFCWSDIWIIVLNIISAILYSTFFVYIKGLMKYKFISPYKCCFMIGMINVPLIIIIYFILSLLDYWEILEICKNKTNFCFNIFKLFSTGLLTDINNIFRLIIFILIYGILMALLTKTINDFTLYHIYVPFLMENFIKNIYNSINKYIEYIESNNISIDELKKKQIGIIIFLIISFFIELIMILIFLEIIEVKFCGLDKNLKKNIELRAITDSTICLDDINDGFDDERYSIEKYNNIIN